MTSFMNNFFGKKHSIISKNYLTTVRLDHNDAGKIEHTHKVNNLEKRFLVWTGKFKNINEVPAFVTQSLMERTRNRMRIRIANYMMLATAVGCIAMIYKGKQDAKRGDTLAKQNKEWHAQMRAEAEAKQ